jgi:hypothetical protein
MTSASFDEAILRILPTEKDLEAWMPTPKLLQLLNDRGHRVDYPKQLRRRLIALERDQLVLSTESGRQRLWQRKSWLHGASQTASLMSAPEALAFHALRRFVGDKLPAAVTKDIEQLFKAADTRLSQERADSRLYRAWVHKIASVEPAYVLSRPAVEPEIFQTITTATFFEREVLVRYRPAYMDSKVVDIKPTRLWPLALVESAGLMYMVAQSPEYPPRPKEGKPDWLRLLYRLDRMVSVEETGHTFTYPEDYRLQDTIEKEQAFDFIPESPVLLELALEPNEARRLSERRMAKDQTLELLPDGRTKATGTVVPSVKLRWWLRSLGAGVEILAPPSLREEFARDVAELAKRYAA